MTNAQARPEASGGGLVRMGELSRLSGVPSSTIKHYLREGLLPGKSVSLARNSALYDRSLVARIQHIKELQTAHFLPLWRIKDVLAGHADEKVATVAAAVERVLEGDGSPRSERVSGLLQRGLTREELDFLTTNGLIGDADTVVGDDLQLCEAIIRARDTGLTDRLSTVAVLEQYRSAVESLVASEIAVFHTHIVAGAGVGLANATVEAMKVSERLVVLLRRRLLLPIFEGTATPKRGATKTATKRPSASTHKKAKAKAKTAKKPR